MKEDNRGSRVLEVVTNVCVIVLLLIILGGGTAGFFYIKNLNKPVETDLSIKNLVIDTSAETLAKGNSQLQERKIHFAGLPNGTLGINSSLILRNPASNEDIYIQYIISEASEDEILFESDLIASGKYIEWVPGDVLSVGEHELVITQQPYYQVDGNGWIPLTTGRNTINIEIIDTQVSQ